MHKIVLTVSLGKTWSLNSHQTPSIAHIFRELKKTRHRAFKAPSEEPAIFETRKSHHTPSYDARGCTKSEQPSICECYSKFRRVSSSENQKSQRVAVVVMYIDLSGIAATTLSSPSTKPVLLQDYGKRIRKENAYLAARVVRLSLQSFNGNTKLESDGGDHRQH